MTSTTISNMLAALYEHERMANQIYVISADDIAAFLEGQPDLVARLAGQDPATTASLIMDAIGSLGILEMVQNAIADAVTAGITWPDDPNPEDPMDGDPESALASAGWGTDEDYGCFGDV